MKITTPTTRVLMWVVSAISLIFALAIMSFLSPTDIGAVESWPHPRPQQATATCPTQATPTPVASCTALPAPVLDRQPQPTTMIEIFEQAGTNRLGGEGPTLTPVWKGYPTPTRVPPYAPCILLKSMAYVENDGWKQFDANYGSCGHTVLTFDCGYGAMQITSGMSGGSGFDPNQVVSELPYNVGTGALILIEKWNTRSNYIGDRNPYVVEDWYFAVWAYNGFGWDKNPNNPQYPDDRGSWACGNDPTQLRSNYPYQELVWGCAANPPGEDFWNASALSLPPDEDLDNGPNNPPPTHISRPEPHHGSCRVVFLPLVMRNWTSIFLFDTFNPMNPNWEIYTSDPDRDASEYVHVYNADGHDDSYSLFITEQVGVIGYDSGARITLTVPPSVSPLELSYWYRRVDHGNFRVKVDGQVVQSGIGSTNWQQRTFDISGYATDGEVTLTFEVPSYIGDRHALLFDEITVSTQ